MKFSSLIISVISSALTFLLCFLIFGGQASNASDDSQSSLRAEYNIAVESAEFVKSEPPVKDTSGYDSCDDSSVLEIPPINKGEEIRAVWVASVYNLNLPSERGLSAEELASEVDELVESSRKNNINTIIFQVRPASDALYRSEIFPSSHFLTGRQGEEIEFDILDYLLYKAHKSDISVFAWINPYRVTTASMTLSDLSEDNPAKKHPDWIYSSGGAYYYNPGIPEVTELIADGVYELCYNYGVDGVIFDDYFYAEEIGLSDYDEYERYGGGLSLADYRRECVNTLVKSCYESVKSVSEDIIFGVSPRGVWRNKSEDPDGSDTLGGAAYDEIYCDSVAFIKGGYIDIISPQIYWPFSSGVCPFGVLSDWWADTVREYGGDKVKLVISLAAYSLSESEIDTQKKHVKNLYSYGGYALYNASSLD